jgi:hypothetical protein
MKRIKFFLAVLGMVVFTRPQRWEWEYKKIKEEYKSNSR